MIQWIIIILLLIIIAIMARIGSKLNNLKNLGLNINSNLKSLQKEFDTYSLITINKNKKYLEELTSIEKIVFSDEDSLVKISKIIELLRNCNSPKKIS